MEWMIPGLFCCALAACLVFRISVLFALISGFFLFIFYGRRKGFSWKELFLTAFEGVKTVKNILIMFLLIGILTAFWRASGTIPLIVSYASLLVRPGVFLLLTFLLNCAVSVLTGTSFGTAATIGVICASMGTSMGFPAWMTGGAVLSGAFFGDRCSAVSTSAHLVAQLTDTGIYDNMKRMLHSALVPFLLTCAIYLIPGFVFVNEGELPDLRAVYGRAFSLHWTALIPAAVILLLSILRVDVKIAMAASIIASAVICLALQHTALTELLRCAVTGYHSSDAQVAALSDGGGIISMLRVAGIVCISSSYSGIFRKTGLLDGIKQKISAFSEKTTPFCAILFTSCVSGFIACNQTLTVILVHQLCAELVEDKSRMANDLEDSAIVIAPLIPWSIAGAVPLASVSAPVTSLLFACFLYLLPLWRLAASFRAKRRLKHLQQRSGSSEQLQ